MNIKETEEKLTQALDAAIANGFTIVCDTWGSKENKTCCAFGALAMLENPDSDRQIGTLAGTYCTDCRNNGDEEGSKNFWSLIEGFNPGGTEISGPRSGPWFELGQRLHEKYKPVRVKDQP